MTKHVRSEDPAPYRAAPPPDARTREAEDALIAKALAVLKRRVRTDAPLTSPEGAADYLRLAMAPLEREEFRVLFLDTRHHLIADETLFVGTLDGATVYPREVVKAALAHNAGAVILAHNHPSGNPEPSQADVRLTERLKAALALVDIHLLDHVVVGHAGYVSLTERWLI